ncbi:hypothetical protein LBMAG56_09720 [Verrucomicrobiota bacterium]|nr:hypothetical protein LBMAG56_09720 [Verrucomicrobiota bacterium]
MLSPVPHCIPPSFPAQPPDFRVTPSSLKSSFPWKRLLAVVITVAALGIIFWKIDVAELAAVFRRMEIGWFLAAEGIFGLMLLAGSWRWHLMLRLTNAAVHPGATARLYAIGHALSFFLLTPAVGDLAKAGLYSRWFRQPLPNVVASAPLARFLGLGGMCIFILVAFALAAAKGALGTATAFGARLPLPLLLVGIAGGLIGLVLIFRWRPRSEHILARTFNSFAVAARQLLLTPRLAAYGLLLGFVVQAISCTLMALCLRAVVSVDCPWFELLWTFPVIAAMVAVPSFGGLGVREAAALGILALYHIPAADAVAGSLLTLATNVTWVVIGAALLAREERLFDKARAQEKLWALPKTISVIIPALNEEAEIPATLRHLQAIPEIAEIIIVDAGSTDRTRDLATAARCRVLTTEPGRGHQLRHGAARATGDVVLMVHADTWLAPDAGRAILASLHDATVVGGGCWKIFRDPPLLVRGSRLKCALRLYLGHRVMADQAIFVRRTVLTATGGVPDVPLMEEFELCRQLRPAGRLALADTVVSTSARRFTQLGVLRTYARMARVTLLYYLGRSPADLRRLYERPPRTR